MTEKLIEAPTAARAAALWWARRVAAGPGPMQELRRHLLGALLPRVVEHPGPLPLGGGVALLDAVGKTVAEFDAKTTLADADRVLVVVQTDGQENSSREFTGDQIRQLIKDREAGGKWSFIYLGAGPDSWAQGDRLGFGKVVKSAHSSEATRSSYVGLASASAAYSKGASGATVSGLIADAVDESGSAPPRLVAN